MIRPEGFRGDSSQPHVVHRTIQSPLPIDESSLETSWIRSEGLDDTDIPGGIYWCSLLCGEVYWQPSPTEGAILVGTHQTLETNGDTTTLSYVPLDEKPV